MQHESAANNLAPPVTQDLWSPTESARLAPITTAQIGTNADLVPDILSLYIPEGSVVADVTFGKGVFWRNVDTSKYVLKPSDLIDGITFVSCHTRMGASMPRCSTDLTCTMGRRCTKLRKELQKQQRAYNEPRLGHPPLLRRDP